MGVLPVLGLLCLYLAVLRICWGGWHISLGYDAGELGKPGVGSGGVSIAGVSRTDAKTEYRGGGKKHGLHGLSPHFRPRLSGSRSVPSHHLRSPENRFMR